MLKRLKTTWREHIALFMCALATAQAKAALPQAQSPNDSGGLLDQIFEWLKASANILGIGICVIAFIAVAYWSVVVFGEVQKGKKTWGDLAICVIIGAIIIVIAIWLLNQANDAASSR
ncbi:MULTISPECIES: TIGR03745 family integrating conjugative element membrane protein [Entomomonas]|uniref:TIGR03745 family integrating conjugative element membrane protein n=1 Tax=Entomomonas asaccharolytica TaxID=2785331 RepID=A0A974NHQ0_9GAMM|nr:MULTISPECIES: TIGR03745 family integrating conjugative element membrane protein [Entomomonas]QQP86848.1 TIGR03745 family integrating conjugative element membrane protein [Entomomonas asaccharolytica]UYZ83534.1 TIGR03745 family integrating conjugative element membrane protein [Entomomonas sp. E2T0]